MTEVIKSNHPAFRPIDVKMGPDGALYIADWYNPIIQHGEVDFRDPRRDKTHGRIWRVTAKGRAARAEAEAGGRDDPGTAGAPEGPRGLDAAAGEAGAEGTRRGEGAAGIGEVGRRRRHDGRRTRHVLEAMWVCHGVRRVVTADSDSATRIDRTRAVGMLDATAGRGTRRSPATSVR